MKNLLARLWSDENGAETAEWLVIAGALVAVGIFVYTGILKDGLSSAATTIGDKIASSAETTF